MARKSTVKCTEIKEELPVTYTYEILFMANDKPERMTVKAIYIGHDGDDLVIFGLRGKEEVEIGGVRNWICFLQLMELPEEDLR